jgi:predicted DNA-binding transcriptional regulator AlpA
MYRRIRALIFSRCFSVLASANSRIDDVTSFSTRYRARSFTGSTEFIAFFLRFGMKNQPLDKDSPTTVLTEQHKYETRSLVMKLSTVEVAKKVGVSRATLERWISRGIIKPKVIQIGKSAFRNWTTADVGSVKRHKQENYRKGRGRKPKPKR